jgi:hypothetical protein
LIFILIMAVKKKLIKQKAGTKNFWHMTLTPQLFWPIFIGLLFFLALSVFNFVSLWRLRVDLSKNLQTIKESINLKETDSLDYVKSENVVLKEELSFLELGSVKATNLSTNGSAEPLLEQSSDEVVREGRVFFQHYLDSTVASFGDSFSSLAYINEEETDMFWDETVTAFSFPPLYSLTKQNDCTINDCGLSREEVNPINICLANGCLRKDDNNNLFFNNRPLLLPPVLDDKRISDVSIFALNNQWLIGLVTGPTEIEKAWVYRFDGLSFSPLFTDETQYQINPRYQRGGGSLAFGGTSEDFLVLYSGYDGIAFRVRGNNIEDVSRFFGLRVTNGGFLAQIFKIGNGAKTNFYICGLDRNNPLFLKIWSKDENSSGGAIDLSALIFKGAFRTDSLLCALNNADEKKIAFASQKGGANELWIFQDLGFDISKSRKITSLNLNRKNKEIRATVIADLGFNYLNNFQFYLANNENDFQATSPYLWQSFAQDGSGLYWRLELRPGDNKFYSPWLNHLNRLDYLFTE